MKTSRLIAGLIVAGLLGLTPPALSAAQTPTRVMATSSSTPAPSVDVVVVGDELEFRGVVSATDPATGITEPVQRGTVMLQVMSSTSSTWSNVATNDFPNQYHFPDVTPKTNSTYRVVYLGYTHQNPYEDDYLPSESGTVEVGVQRKVTIKTDDLTAKGKVAPDFAKQKVTVLKKVGKKYRKLTTVKTDAKGRFRVTFTARRAQRVHFAVEVPGDEHFVKARVLGQAIDY